ncbi:hypothetical protein [Actinoplanes sp. NPDC051851]|uniref:hypothetical protein n=1 Tax=Actinoplanes sp. NPDC051851 TaxID=3154753 RepID=UPI00342D5480
MITTIGGSAPDARLKGLAIMRFDGYMTARDYQRSRWNPAATGVVLLLAGLAMGLFAIVTDDGFPVAGVMLVEAGAFLGMYGVLSRRFRQRRLQR